jgi:PIN domain nuclease of toxin-antitoxin system
VNLLIDTHIFLWWEWRSLELPEFARVALVERGNKVVVSAATIWEVSIKRQTGRLDFEGDLIEACAKSGFEILPIAARHADRAGALPLLHTDPFDRMLVAQAEIEGLVLVTQDRKLVPYGIPLLGRV